MAKVTLNIEDDKNGEIIISIDSDVPFQTNLTQAQILGLHAMKSVTDLVGKDSIVDSKTEYIDGC